MWVIDVIHQQDIDFLKNLTVDNHTEIVNNFKEIIGFFDNLRSSTHCENAVLPIKSYKLSNENLTMLYNIDNDEEIIRITGFVLE